MGWPKKLVFVRHGESEGNVLNANDRIGLEVPTYAYGLTERGKLQAAITGKFLMEKFGLFDVYYTSYYERSIDTMKIMYPEAKIYEDARLAEGQRGIWHVMDKEMVEKRFPEEILRKEREGLYHYRPIGGENWPDMELRIHSFLGTLSRDCDGLNVLISCHGHWEIMLQRLIHHFSIEKVIQRRKEEFFDNASVTIYSGVEVNGKSRLVLDMENFVPWEGKI